MIHRDNRRHYESASGLGQIIHREGYRYPDGTWGPDGKSVFTTGDIDHYVRKWLGTTTLIRLIEHKQPEQQLKKQQLRALLDLDRIIAYAATILDLHIHPDSGVYIMRGEISAETAGQQKVNFGGPQIIYDVRGRQVFQPKNRHEFFRWLDGEEVDLSAINRIRPPGDGNAQEA